MAATFSAPIEIDGKTYRSVKEGQASVLAPYRGADAAPRKGVGKGHNNDEGDQAVFYNPIQQYNRDLSVLAILIYGESAVYDKKNRRQTKSKDKSKKKQKQKAESREAANGQHKEEVTNKRTATEAEISIEAPNEQSSKKPRVELEIEDDDLDIAEIPDPQTQAPLVHDASKSADVSTESQTNAQTHQITLDGQPVWKSTTVKDGPKPTQFTILDALSASGLRAIRYAKEIPFATTIIANDLLPEATKAIDLNIKYNELSDKVYSHVGDARHYMYGKTGQWKALDQPGYVHRFDVIDLDPYGSASVFLDAALQAIADGGLLCVTCTDAGVWASNGYPEKCFALYGGIPTKGAFSHEAGLRLILNSIATTAARYGLAIEPLLSLSIDFYARVFVRVHKSPQDVKLLAGTSMLLYSCDSGCGAWETQPLARNQERKDKAGGTFYKHSFAQAPSTNRYCDHCGAKSHLAGPMWAGPIHNPHFIQKILDRLPHVDKTVYQTTDRIEGMLTCALEEDLSDFTMTTKPPTPNNNTTTPADPTPISITTTAGPSTTTLTTPNPSIPRLPPQLIDPTPLFIIPSNLSHTLHCITPSEPLFRSALINLGYRVTRSHCKAGSIKTNAPWSVLWEVMREWIVQREGQKKIDRLLGTAGTEWEGKPTLGLGTPGRRIMRRLRGDRDKAGAMRVVERVRTRLLGGHGVEAQIDSVEDVKELLRSALWEVEHPEAETRENGRPRSASVGSASGRKVEKDVSELNIVFDEAVGKDMSKGKVVRYQMNPRANWGPMHRAGGA